MIDTVTDVQQEVVATRIAQLRARSRHAGAAAIFLGAIGALFIAGSVSRMDDLALAVFIVGLTLIVCATVMVVGWGASSGHADVIHCCDVGRAKVAAALAARLDDVEQFQRVEVATVAQALDEVARRREKRA